ncbi:HD domain-containing protein [Labilibacter sediminis]|nr:HD domain-containing protein [Labilibacter sediminis]
MTSHQSFLLNQIKKYASNQLNAVDAGHDLTHIHRVLENARRINEIEKGDAFLIEAGVWLHDVTDEKLFDKQKAEAYLISFLKEIKVEEELISTLVNLINSVSFGSEFNGSKVLSKEQMIVRDADRLDAMGAIGIARTFHYGGSKNRELFNASIPPKTYASTEDYRKSESPTVNHFYEKLLLLKDKMETSTGKTMAEERHNFMLNFLKQFYAEIGEKGFSL